jgi:hypothetical protein
MESENKTTNIENQELLDNNIENKNTDNTNEKNCI